MKLVCKKGHTKVEAELLSVEDNWLRVRCATCKTTLWYNGA